MKQPHIRKRNERTGDIRLRFRVQLESAVKHYTSKCVGHIPTHIIFNMHMYVTEHGLLVTDYTIMLVTIILVSWSDIEEDME